MEQEETPHHRKPRRPITTVLVLVGMVLCLIAGGLAGVVGAVLYARRALAPDRARDLIEIAESVRQGDAQSTARGLEERIYEQVWRFLRNTKNGGVGSLSKSELDVLQKLKSYRDRYSLVEPSKDDWDYGIRQEVTAFLEQVPWAKEDQVRRAFLQKYRSAEPARAPSLEGVTWLGANSVPPDLSGKVVLLDFWGLKCGYCLEAFPRLQDLWERFHDRGFQVVALHCQRPDGQRVADLFGGKGYRFPVGQSPKQLSLELWVGALPAYYLVDRAGRLVRGPEQRLPSAEEIESLIKEGGGAKASTE